MNAFMVVMVLTFYDRGRGSVLRCYKTTRHNIDDSEVTFEKCLGI